MTRKFELSAPVQVVLSGQPGRVVGIVEYEGEDAGAPRREYQVAYMNVAGDRVRDWFGGAELAARSAEPVS